MATRMMPILDLQRTKINTGSEVGQTGQRISKSATWTLGRQI